MPHAFPLRRRPMPLHDWTEVPGWDGVHQVWIVELLYWLKPRLPAGYRAYIGTTPTFAIGAPPDVQPDVVVRELAQGQSPEEPDQEIAVATLADDRALFVERQGQLIAAV